MLNWKNLPASLFLAISIIFIHGCSLDDPGSSSSNPPLALHADQNLSLITLSWDPVKVTGFKEYILLQSTSDIPNSPTPEVNAETTVLKRIDDSDIHSFTLTNTLFAPRLCFKLYTAVDDRFIYSSTLCIDQDFTVFNGFNDRAGHDEGSDQEVLFDRTNGNFSIIDYKSGEFTNTLNDFTLTFPIIDVSTYEQITYVFAYDQSPPRIMKYKFPELTALTFKQYNGVLFAVNTHKQFVFIAIEEAGQAFQVLSRTTLNKIDSRPGTTGNRNIAVFEGNPLVVLEIGEVSINKYTIDPAGKITQSEQILTGINQMNVQNTIANSDTLYVGGRLGYFVNKDAEIIGTVTNDINSFVSMNRFSPDRTKLVSIINNNASTRLVINDVTNMPHITNITSYDIPPANYSDVIVEEDIIYVIGVTFSSGQAQTFILKYPI